MVFIIYNIRSAGKRSEVLSPTDIESKCMDAKEGRVGGGMNWEVGVDIYTLLILCLKYIMLKK